MLAKPITINNFQRGLAPGPAFGFHELRGLNITDKPGYCFPNLATRKDQNVTLTGQIEGWCKNATTVFGHTGTDKKLYYRSTYNDWAAMTGHADAEIHHIFIYKGYVGVVQGDDIAWFNASTYAFVDTSTDWTNVLSGTSYQTVLAQDDALYIIGGSKIDKLVENTTFDPSDTDTYALTQGVATFPSGLSFPVNAYEIGDFIYVIFENAIYPYNALAAEDLFETPIKTDKPVQQAIQFNKRLYLQMGYKGEWYRTDGTSFTRVAKLPASLFSSSAAIYTYQGCVHNDLIYFTVGGGSAPTAYTPQGVYSFDPEFDETEIKQSRVNLEYIVSTGGFGATNGIQFGPLLSLGSSTNGILIPYKESTTYRVDSLNTTNFTGDVSYLVSSLYRLNSALDAGRNTIDKLYIYLTKPMVSGDSIKLYWRENLSTGLTAGWTQIGATWNTVGEFSKFFTLSISPKNIQIKAVLNNTAELAEIVLQ